MTLPLIVLILVFLGLLVLPFLPGIGELWRPRDDAPLAIDRAYTRNPRWFGFEFRERLRPALSRVEAALSDSSSVAGEPSPHIHKELTVAAKTRLTGTMVVLGDAVVETEGRIEKGYVLGNARFGVGARVNELACDGEVDLSARCRVDHWLDAESDVRVGSSCLLGLAVGSGKTLHLDHGCTFKRLWGLPISTRSADDRGTTDNDGPNRMKIEDVVVWGRKSLSFPKGMAVDRDVVVHADLNIGPECTVFGNIKAQGHVRVHPGAQIDGNVFSRRSIRVGEGAWIKGNLFAEGDVIVETGARIGRPEKFKSVIAGGCVHLFSNVRIFGWVVAERGGRTE